MFKITLVPGFEKHRQECLCHTGMAVLSMARLRGTAEEKPISLGSGSCATGVAQTLLSVLSNVCALCVRRELSSTRLRARNENAARESGASEDLSID